MGSERGSSSGPGGCIPADRHHTEAWAVLSCFPPGRPAGTGPSLDKKKRLTGGTVSLSRVWQTSSFWLPGGKQLVDSQRPRTARRMSATVPAVVANSAKNCAALIVLLLIIGRFF